jgi:2-polyprenyl-3-methyl-5-hydroxy-6-metoxy-1,4-benzoquinol methylase
MIKKLIKKQIKKTGMVKELENNNKNLQKQFNDLDKANQQLQTQINFLKSDNEDLQFKLKEKSEIIGFSLKENLRGLSSDEAKIPVLKYIVENVKKDAQILDVGFGAGAYGKLLRSLYYRNIDGLDIYSDNIEEMGLDKIYDNIYIDNILYFDFDYYDLIIMGDLLEHIELESAKKLLSSLIKDKCGQIIISVPYEYEQDELYGNKYEKHLQPDMNELYMKKHYPCLKLVEMTNSTSGHIIATYYWKK